MRDGTSRRESMCWLECNGTSRAARIVQIHVTVVRDAGKTGRRKRKKDKRHLYSTESWTMGWESRSREREVLEIAHIPIMNVL